MARSTGSKVASQDAPVLQMSQPVRQRLRTDARQRPAQLAEALATGEQVPDDQRRPPALQYLQLYRELGDDLFAARVTNRAGAPGRAGDMDDHTPPR
jgi:hypothetical protein